MSDLAPRYFTDRADYWDLPGFWAKSYRPVRAYQQSPLEVRDE